MVTIRKIPQTGLRIQAKMETPHRVKVQAGNKVIKLDMPELLGGTHKGMMPLEALIAAYAGSLNVVGNFVAHTTDFDLRAWEFTIWAEFDPSGIWGLEEVTKPIHVVHIRARVVTPESERRLKLLRKEMKKRDPIHNILKNCGVRFKEEWERIEPEKSATKRKKQ